MDKSAKSDVRYKLRGMEHKGWFSIHVHAAKMHTLYSHDLFLFYKL